MKRAIVIVLDGCGAGAAPDVNEFPNQGDPATLNHVWESKPDMRVPTLAGAGYFAAAGVPLPVGLEGFGVRYARLEELSKGMDSVTGHWEMMGIVTREPFPTYPKGFPISLVKEFEREIGTQTLGNRAASGTAIINELGQLHLETGFPILYTSADSVFQVACHEDIVPVDQLYEFCRIARRICVKPNDVQRVIARPFVGNASDGFTRTDRRKDFPLEAPPNLCDVIGDVYGIGVVPELFDFRSYRKIPRTGNNAEHEIELMKAFRSDARFIFANFEDFDMLYGHRNDTPGFARALEDFDGVLWRILALLKDEDLLILTADHGNDPTTSSTDHSREFVPCSVIGRGLKDAALGDVEGLTAVGATVADHLEIEWDKGTSLLST